MNVLSDDQLFLRYSACFVAGILIAALAYSATRWYAGDAGEQQPPVITSQTPNTTVARIPTLRNGKPVYCTVIIGHMQDSWSVNC